MTRTTPAPLRHHIDAGTYADPEDTLHALIAAADLDAGVRKEICATAAELVRAIRNTTAPGIMEVFLAEYGLSTDEGVALMCLAEALLRVPDADTIDALIEDKIAPSDWGRHLGHSTSSLVNASTWALMLTGRVLDDEQPGPVRHLRAAIKRLGEPVIRTAVSRAMKEMGRQFVLGENINAAMERAANMEKKGFTYSYDMLGEAARTEADAKRYHLSYSRAISAIATACTSDDIRKNPGISVKLSALHPRYELAQERGRDDRSRAASARARALGEIRGHGPERRCRGSGPAGPLARGDRPGHGGARACRMGRFRHRCAGLRPARGHRDPDRSTTWRKSMTAGSWCGWSRAPIGTRRSNVHRSRAWTAFPSSRRRRRPMSPISAMPRPCSA